jgi:hypothetical protein
MHATCRGMTHCVMCASQAVQLCTNLLQLSLQLWHTCAQCAGLQLFARVLFMHESVPATVCAQLPRNRIPPTAKFRYTCPVVFCSHSNLTRECMFMYIKCILADTLRWCDGAQLALFVCKVWSYHTTTSLAAAGTHVHPALFSWLAVSGVAAFTLC